MIDDNIIYLSDVFARRGSAPNLIKQLDEVFDALRVDYDAMRRILHPMGMKERGIVGTALFEALVSPAPTLDQLALLLIVAQREDQEGRTNET